MKELPTTPWAASERAIAEELDVDVERGLGKREARRRLEIYGPNQLRKASRRSVLRILVDQLKSFVVALLFAAALAAAAFGHYLDAAAVALVLVINAAIGFFTELRARRSMEALRKLGQVECTVLRGGDEKRLQGDQLVPGDVVLLDEGDIVPADLRLFDVEQLQVDESTMTGESMPVDKDEAPVATKAVLADRTSMAFKGTAVTKGDARGIVVATGMKTELGHVSEMVEEAEGEDTPLEKQLDHLGRRLVWLTIVVAAVVVGVGLLAERDTWIMVEMGIALAVAAIPEGLPIVATVALARGMRRMLARNALMRKLASVQTLGATNVICTDKTGTLTENQMALSTLLLPSGRVDFDEGREEGAKPSADEESVTTALRAAVLCNGAELRAAAGEKEGERQEKGDPLEVALLAAGQRFGLMRDELLEQHEEVRRVEFDRATTMMATYHHDDGGLLVAVKGASEAVIDACTSIRGSEGEPSTMGEEDRALWHRRSEELAAEGLRVLGIAQKRVSEESVEPYEDLELLGLVGLLDPPRANVRSAVERCRKAGITVVMVTGDHPETAKAIARKVGIAEEEDLLVIHGAQFEERAADRRRARVFARVSPEQKLEIIDAHREAGDVVAMTGDGVNDAPALKRADIGVAMGKRGTQVAVEAADAILLDDAFETIAAAVEQGRIIFENIRRFVVYLLSGNIGEILAVGIASVMQSPLPLLPLQILYLNMLNDVFPALALGVGPSSPGVMERPPRSAGEPVLTQRHWMAIGGYGVLIGAMILGAFAYARGPGGLSDAEAVTVAFLTLSIGRLVHTFNMRSVHSGVLDNEITRNPFAWGAFAVCGLLLGLAIYIPPLASTLSLVVPSPEAWAIILCASALPFVVGQPILFALRLRSK